MDKIYNKVMKSNNKKRILQLIEILKKNTDMDHKLSLNQIVSLLEEEGIEIQNRKTLYDDFKALSDFGYEVDYNNGYYLTEAPFTLSEVKIIIDSLNSLKNLDDALLVKINNKLYSFISDYEEKLLRKLEYHNKHSDKKFIHRMEDILEAINNNKTIIINRPNKDEEEICPIFLYRNNDYYYLYYHYLKNEKIYHTRFDNILNTKITNKDNDINISKNKIIETINESSNSFYSNKAELIKFKITNDSDYLRTRLSDDFANIIFTNNGFSIKASVNDAFFSRLTSYADNIKISDKNIADQYIKYLNRIITRNKAKD